MPRRPKDFKWATKDNLRKLYVEQELSWTAIGKKYGVFGNTVRRAAKRLGITSRSRSEAQSSYLEKNEHPMLGRERPEEEKQKISQGVQENWEGLTPQEIEERKKQMSERAKKRWDSLDDKEKEQTIKKMHQASRAQAGRGSKNENAVAELLINAGYNVIQRTNEFSPGRRFEVDIALPDEQVAIEWDGAAHFEPIYGEEALKKTQTKDAVKDKALVAFGWSLIRARDRSTAYSRAFAERSAEKLIETIGSLNKSDNKLIVLEME